MNESDHTIFTLIPLSGEQEVTARTAGLSSVIIFGTFVPLLLILVIIFYRHVKQKNAKLAEQERQLQFAKVEQQRLTLYEKMQADDQKRAKEIDDYLENALKAEDMHAPPQLKMIDELDGDETDDEFFEMPLPPLPAEQTSVIDNETVATASARVQETPKIENAFVFPPVPLRHRPPPLQINPLPPPIPQRSFSASLPSPSAVAAAASASLSEQQQPINPIKPLESDF
jgi:hypothetical protein